MKYKILLVEDDRTISEEIRKHLTSWDYEVEPVQDFERVMETFAAVGPHLVILDISLPFFNGYYWCTQIRNVSTVPILFLSSASDQLNIVMAMNMGGDDYVTKPFELSVLSAKVQAMLRRTYDFGAPSSLLGHKGVILNLSAASLEANGETIDLTKNEFRILHLLFEQKGRVVSREAIMQHLWNSDCFIDDNTLAVNMTRLRRKLEEAGLHDFIVTKKGIGYALDT